MQRDGEAAVIALLEQGVDNELNNQQQLLTAASNSNRWNSAGSSGHFSTLASLSVAQSKARTRQNVICSAI